MVRLRLRARLACTAAAGLRYAAAQGLTRANGRACGANRVLNGLGLRVERAFLETIDADDGTGVKLARNRYFLTDARGHQVEDLHLLELNMQEHCTNCAPSVADLHMDTWRQNNVGICNEEHPEFTLVKIQVRARRARGHLRPRARCGREGGCARVTTEASPLTCGPCCAPRSPPPCQDENRKPELLLESAATLTAMGYCIHSATYDVSNEEDAPACDIDDLACRGESSVKSSRQTPSGMGAGNISNARTLVFRITGSYGKLSYQQASGLLYVFGIQLDKQLLLSPL